MSSDRLRAAALLLALGACATPAPSADPTPAPTTVAAATRTPPAAQAACAMPAGERLVDVTSVDRTIRTEIRYATTNNFTHARLPGYEHPVAMLRPEVAAALGRVQARLRADGYGLKVFDAYRPIRATLAMVSWAQRSGNAWVLEQGYVARRSGHNQGHTVDLTLVRLASGAEVDMGTPFDTFSEAAHTANATGAARDNRARLLRAMEAEGFVNYSKEWWHFGKPGSFTPLDVPLACFR